MQESTRIAEPFHRRSKPLNYDAIVIGSGIGGLAAAALLARHGGRRVLVLERHYTVGGFTHVFRRPGYEWDVGVHYIGNTAPGGLVRAIFDEVSAGRLQWADMGPVYERVRLGTISFDFPRGEAALSAALCQAFPREKVAIQRYFQLVHECVEAMHGFLATQALPRVLGPLLKPRARSKFFGFSDRTTRQVLESLTQDQTLIGILTAQFSDYGLPPAESSFAMHALVAHHYFEGGAFPIGGAGQIAATIVPTIREAGGEIYTNAEVSEILVRGNRAVGVRMADDTVIEAPWIISDTGAPITFGELLPREISDRHGLRSTLRNLRPSIAHASVYVGLRGTTRELGIDPSNLWIFPDEHHERSFAAAATAEVPPNVYISFPSAKDPSFPERFPGRSTIQIATLLPYERFTRWAESQWHKRGAEYEREKQRLVAGLLEILYSHVPRARGAVEIAELSTPLSTRHFSGHRHGEIYGLEHTPARFRCSVLRPRTPVRGLYLTGADVAVAGVGGALLGGAICASALLYKNLIDLVQRRTLAKVAA